MYYIKNTLSVKSFSIQYALNVAIMCLPPHLLLIWYPVKFSEISRNDILIYILSFMYIYPLLPSRKSCWPQKTMLATENHMVAHPVNQFCLLSSLISSLEFSSTENCLTFSKREHESECQQHQSTLKRFKEKTIEM